VVLLSFIASPFFNAHERKIEISELQVCRGGVGWGGMGCTQDWGGASEVSPICAFRDQINYEKIESGASGHSLGW